MHRFSVKSLGFKIASVSVMAGLWILSSSRSGGAQQEPTSDSLPEDIPEEVLQLEMLLPAYSTQTGQAQSPAAYSQTQQTLQVKADAVPPQLPSVIPGTVNSLRLLKLLKGLIPFL